MRDPAVQDQIFSTGTGQPDEQLGPVGGVRGHDADEAGAGHMPVGDSPPQGCADQRVRKIIHPYTMPSDLAARPVQP